MLLYLRLLKESFAFAINALTNNKLRTFLSLLGVTIGIFSIIAVLAAVDSLDRKIKADMNKVDKNTMYLKRFSFAPTDIPAWRREQFPDVTYDEYQYLKDNVASSEYMAYQMFTNAETLTYEKKTATGINMIPTSHEFIDIQKEELDKGRFYNESESNRGSAVIVLGYDVAETLFGDDNPIDKKIRVYGRRFTVIGVLKKVGSGGMGMGSNDTAAIFPVNMMRNMYGDNNDFMTPIIIIKPKQGADAEATKADITQKLRLYRGIKASEGDNFMIDIISSFTEFIDQIIGVLNMVGWIISGFSLLVGGFGIANIMFVSVKERTNIIGIQKSLGAKNHFILFQFLFEAVILSLIGGLIGILMVKGAAAIASSIAGFDFVLSFGNIMLGFSISTFIGLVAGILPARSASKLDPVEAIRSGM
ncbi:ABC transporter permease [Flavobacterium akiainvivens]|uniref:ABC transporter permease n=1 Tax=Flavobacterium akiainvivens TaxID=1202724 RepID=A0A0M8MFB8_9FLAO|nr:ABC transporter permease [Flavobacterium akiainvivens]KOS07724.1 ABC transporter permease [Flavobacterium akiainvivens]SFQ25071.1 putative ABC transport system permease protein [Flavobacterium akiainvivens]